MSLKQLPAFASEAEEAAWWYENRAEHDAEFVRAIQEGRVRRTSLAQRLAAAKHIAMVQLSGQDTENAKMLAERRGVETQALLSDLLHTAIQQEVERAA